MLLSICIPTYNRGERALGLVESMLPLLKKYNSEIEIVVSNNGSTVGADYYARIESMEVAGLRYHAFDRNRYYVGNFNQVIKMSRGQFCLLISDEDRISESALGHYLDLIREGAVSDTAVIRARTSSFYSSMEVGRFAAGSSAVEHYFMLGNYISGIMYNRHFLTDEVIDSLAEKYGDSAILSGSVSAERESRLWADRDGGETAYFYYPHMYVDGLLLSRYDLLVDETVLIDEGRDAGDVELAGSAGIKVYATLEQRLDQLKGFIKFVDELECDDATALSMVKNIVLSTSLLLKHVRQAYEMEGRPWSDICRVALEYISGELAGCSRRVVSCNADKFTEWAGELLGYADDSVAEASGGIFHESAAGAPSDMKGKDNLDFRNSGIAAFNIFLANFSEDELSAAKGLFEQLYTLVCQEREFFTSSQFTEEQKQQVLMDALKELLN